MNKRRKPTREEADAIRRDVEGERPRVEEWARDVASRAATVGEKLRALRQSCGVSLAGLAKLSGMDKSSLSRLENGHRSPSFETIARYARALGKDVDLSFHDAA